MNYRKKKRKMNTISHIVFIDTVICVNKFAKKKEFLKKEKESYIKKKKKRGLEINLHPRVITRYIHSLIIRIVIANLISMLITLSG